MKTVIIEDENLPAKRLEKLLKEVKPETEILAVLQTVDESIEWLQSKPLPDIVFMDIHLADGLSFSILEEVEIKCPIVFTTAYDQYALKAFEVNSIDYLLKPVRKEDLERALSKLELFGAGNPAETNNTIFELARLMMQNAPTYKHSFLVSIKDTMIPVQVKDIAYFCLENKSVGAFTLDGKRYNIDGTMDEILRQLDPHDFFRANRQYTIARSSIKNIATWFGSRVVVNLTIPTERIVISRTHVTEFKKWITG